MKQDDVYLYDVLCPICFCTVYSDNVLYSHTHTHVISFQKPTVVGKPSPLMIDYLCNKLGLDKSRICMVGDRLDTDILFGTDNGLQSLLVLSGVTTEEKLLSQENTITPDYYADSIVDFFVDENAKVETTA